MKNFLAILLAALITPLCCAQPATQPDVSTINIAVDARVELLAIIQFLSPSYDKRTGLMAKYDIDYKNDVTEHFGEFKEHRAVKLFDKMSPRGFSYDGPVLAVLHLDNTPQLKERAPLSREIMGRAGSREQLRDFYESMREFSEESQFQEFFKKQSDLYESMVAEIKGKLEGVDITMLEEYYGERKNSYNIIISPLLHPGGFGPQVTLADGSLDIYSVGGPISAENGIPHFQNAASYRYLIWHEFSHSFVNPAMDKYSDQVEAVSELFTPLMEKMALQSYGLWSTCVNEHIVRAVTTRFTEMVSGKEAATKAMEYETSHSFVHAPMLTVRLKVYEQNRDKYPNFNDFVPELIDVFQEAIDSGNYKATSESAGGNPKVIKSIPTNRSNAVDPSIKEIHVVFNQDMNQDGFSWVQLDQDYYPETTGPPRWISARECVLPVAFEPNHIYRIGLNVSNFIGFTNTKGIAADSFTLEFMTRGDLN